MIQWALSDGDTSIVNYNSSRDSDEIMVLVNSEDGTEAVIKCIGPLEEYRILGVAIRTSLFVLN